MRQRVLPIRGGCTEVGSDMTARRLTGRRAGASTLRGLLRALVLALGLTLGPAVLLGAVPATAAPGAGSGRAGSEVAPARDSLFPSVGNPGYDVSSYGIDLRFHRGAGSITATTRILARTTGRLASFTLDLEGLSVDAVTVDGKVARWHRSGHKLRVVPTRAVVGRFVTTIRYHGVPTTHTDPDGAADGWIPTAGGATVLSEPLGAMTWFPVNNVPRDKASFRVAVTVPPDLEVAGNGVLSKRRNAASTTWTWRQRQPMAPYLAMISIGQYDVFHSSMRLVGGRRIPVWSFVEHGLAAAAVRNSRAARVLLPVVVRFEEQRYGAYPFDSVGIVVAKLRVGYALETQTRPVFDGDIDTSTLVHELAHQWFGDSVTPCDWGDIWLNEGFASYAESLWTAAHGGPSTAVQLDQAYAAADASLWSPAPAALSDPADLFSDPVYTRGGMTLQVLRERIGSAAFFATLRQWTGQNAGGCVTTGGFAAKAEYVSGASLDRLFDDWLYTARKPALPPS